MQRAQSWLGASWPRVPEPSSATIVVDTGVLVSAADTDDPRHDSCGAPPKARDGDAAQPKSCTRAYERLRSFPLGAEGPVARWRNVSA